MPKKELVTSLQLVLQAGRLKLPSKLPLTGVLVRELQTFQVKITFSAHEVIGTCRDGEHDDLVLALALGCWWAERFGCGRRVAVGGKRVWADNAPASVFLEP